MTGWWLYWVVTFVLASGMFGYMLVDSYADMGKGVNRWKCIGAVFIVSLLFGVIVSAVMVGSLYWEDLL